MTLQSSLPVPLVDVSMLHGCVTRRKTVTMEVTKETAPAQKISLHAGMARVYQELTHVTTFMIVMITVMKPPSAHVTPYSNLNVMVVDA